MEQKNIFARITDWEKRIAILPAGSITKKHIVLLETKLANPQKQIFVLQFPAGVFCVLKFLFKNFIRLVSYPILVHFNKNNIRLDNITANWNDVIVLM